MKKIYLFLFALLMLACPPGQAKSVAGLAPIIDVGPNLPALERQEQQNAISAPTEVINQNVELPAIQGKATAGTVAAKKAVRKAIRTKTASKSLDQILGTYVSSDYSYYSSDYVHSVVTILQRNDSLLVKNLYGLQTEVAATYDASTGVLSIAPQLIYTSSSYGACWICSWDGSNPLVYDTKTAITATLQDDGSFKLSPWGVYVAEGASKGGVFNAFSTSALNVPNATFHTVTYSTGVESDYPLLIIQNYDNQLEVVNFINNGSSVFVSLRSDSTSYIGSQKVATYAVYGDFNVYAATTAGKVSKFKYITGTPTETGISLSPWGAFCVKSTSIAIANVATSEICFNGFTPKYPAKVAVNFDGAGSESSPYLIKTLADLQALSQSVLDGEKYSGKYFALANDIDASTSTGVTYQSIGFDETYYFDGTFDGASHTISNLTIDAKGDNYGGLFGIVGAKASVKNLTLKDAAVLGSGKYVGAVIGYNNGGKVENCHVSGAIDANVLSVGGIVGYSTGTISKCDFSGSVSGGAEVGGVVGCAKADVTDCHSSATIKVTDYSVNTSHGAGGVVGDVIGSSKLLVNVKRCYFTGSVSDAQKIAYLGGVVGGLYSGSISECFNTGAITCGSGQVSGGTAQGAGGITGYMSNGEVVDCYNAGVVNAPYNNESAGIVGYAGGYTNSMSKIHSSYSSGMLANNTTFEYRGVMGGYFDKSVLDIENAYYDYQSSGLDTIAIGYKSTAELTSGEALPGFSTDVWVFEKGLYPRLKSIMDNEVANLSAAPMFLQNNENANKVKTSFTVSDKNNITWAIYSNGSAVSKGDGIEVSGTNVNLTGKYGNDYLLAIDKENNFKYYTIITVASDYEGDGTAANPYVIKTKSDLEKLASAVNVYKQSHRGDYFIVANDIDMQGDETFQGIATKTGQVFFNGQFDGQNHTIDNIVLNGADNDEKYLGLFGICGPTSVIKNVRIGKNSKFSFDSYSAPVIGYTEGKVYNCRNYADVKAYGSYTGGVVGAAAGDTVVVDGCYNAGAISAGTGRVGGITGYNSGVVSNSRNDGAIDSSLKGTSTNALVGGIVGYNFGTVKNSLNTASIEGDKQVGGIIGGNTITSSTGEGGNIEGNINTSGSISAELYVGAIVGQVYSRGTVAGNYYDSQINPNGAADSGALTGATSSLTSELTAGKALEGLADNTWTFVSGSYPALSAFADETTANTVDKIVLSLDNLDNVNAVSTDATLSSGATWSVAGGSAFAVAGNLLKVTAPSDTVIADTLTAVSGDVVRTFALRTVPAIFSGKGTQDDPYQITVADDMGKLANAVEKFGMNFERRYFKVMNDIDFKDYAYKVVASGDNTFQAYFDGNGKKFTNLTIEDKTNTDLALFGTVGSAGTIANLTIESGSVTAKANAAPFAVNGAGTFMNLTNNVDVVATTSGYAGGIAVYGLEGAKFINCVNNGSIALSAKSYVGGITASGVYCSYDSCVNNGTIITVTSGAGGIAGTMLATVTNCTNNGEITATKAANYLGGIAGSEEAGSRIENCLNKGDITMGSKYVGGIIGNSTTSNAVEHASAITNCVNEGSVSGASYVGGIVGKLAAGHDLSSSQNKGAVSGTAGYTAGIVAQVSGNSGFTTSVTDCHNYGKVTNSGTSGNYVAGILAYGSSVVEVTKSTNHGRVVSKGQTVGGIAGSISGTVSECINAAPVEGQKRAVAGIAGYGSDLVIDKCVNLDSIIATGAASSQGEAGGIAGYGNPLTITNSYNMGAVTAVNKAAGIVPFYYKTCKIENCYNAAPVTISATSAKVVANIIPYATDEDVVVTNCYYDSTECTTYDPDTIATALSTAALTEAKLGEAFANKSSMYPTLTVFADSALVNYYAATLVLDDKDTFNSVELPFKYGVAADGTAWTSSSNISLADGVGTSSAIGEGWVTKTFGSLSKTWKLNIKAVSGINDIVTDKAVLGRTYYDLNGRLVVAPADGIFIEVTKYVDGTVASKKVVK